MPETKTDNSYERDKAALRVSMLPDGEVSVLDCYAGRGVVWKAVEKLSGRKIKRLPIDIRADDIGFHLPGSNVGWLKSIDLRKYTIVDLDAYGVPYEQLQILFDRRYSGLVFVTFIQSVMGRMPSGLLESVGFSRTQIEKAPTLLGHRGWQYFLQYLALNGVSQITHRSAKRKHYLGFQLC